MRIYKSLFFLGLLVLTACSSKPIPAGIIPPEKMVPLLVDLHIIDGGLLSISQSADSLYKYGTGNYSLVLQKHHTDTVQFKNSFKYYSANPEELDEIYDNVIKALQFKNDSILKIKVKPAPAPATPPPAPGTNTTPQPNAVPAK